MYNCTCERTLLCELQTGVSRRQVAEVSVNCPRLPSPMFVLKQEERERVCVREIEIEQARERWMLCICTYIIHIGVLNINAATDLPCCSCISSLYQRRLAVSWFVASANRCVAS